MIAIGSILNTFKTLLSKPGTYGWIIVIVAIIACIVLWSTNKRLGSENDRQEHNYSVLDGEFVKEKDEHGKDIIKIQQLELTNEDIRDSKDSIIRMLVKEASYNGIKAKKLENILFIKQRVIDSISGIIGDTIYITTEGDTVQWLSRFNDGYLDATNYIMNSMKKTSLSYSYTDSVFVFGHWERKPLRLFKRDINWLRIGSKEHNIDIKFANKKATPLYSKQIKIYKNKRQYRINN